MAPTIEIVELALEEVVAGQTLGAEVCDAQGNCLLAAGCVLSERHLMSLANKGVTRVSVQQPVVVSEQEHSERRAQIEQQLEQRFRKMQDQPQMLKLKELVLRYRLEALA